VLAAFAMGALVACSRPAPEEALRDRIATLADAVGARDRRGIEAALHREFIGPGGLDRDGVRRLASGVFLRHRDIEVVLGPVELLSLEPASARARFTAAVAGGTGGILPEQAQLYEVETAWRLEDGEWRLLSAEWDERL
jgi:hypothetical protein